GVCDVPYAARRECVRDFALVPGNLGRRKTNQTGQSMVPLRYTLREQHRFLTGLSTNARCGCLWNSFSIDAHPPGLLTTVFSLRIPEETFALEGTRVSARISRMNKLSGR